MISGYDIKQFLSKPVTNHTWVKELSEAYLDKAIDELNPKPQLHAELRMHQKACFLLAVAYPQFYQMLDLGLGKTLTTLELLKYFYQTGKLRKWTLILCPMDELVDSWEDEIKRWDITIPYVVLRGSSAQKWQTLRGFERGLVLGTYVGISTMCCEMRAAPTKQNPKRRKHLPVPEYIDTISKRIEGFIADQSTKIGNVESLSYKVIRDLAKPAKVRYNLAGRPFARDPLLLWSQFYVMDRGQTLTPNYSFFREVFFDKKKAWFGGPNTYEYKFKRELHPQLSRLLCNRSISYARSECLDLPLRTYMKRIVQQPKDVSLQYRKVVDEALSHRGSFTEMQNAFVRMRQICSGFVALKEDVDDESKAARIQLAFKDNPKLDSLLELLDEMPDDSKAIVFYEFTYSAKLIGEALKKKKIPFGWLWAGTKNWPEIKKQFDTDPEFRILLNQHKKGGMGLNLQAADYTIFYESPVSALERDEAEGRNYRQGQTKPVMVYDIIMKDSIDEQILAYHKEGNSLFKALVADPNKVLKK